MTQSGGFSRSEELSVDRGSEKEFATRLDVLLAQHRSKHAFLSGVRGRITPCFSAIESAASHAPGPAHARTSTACIPWARPMLTEGHGIVRAMAPAAGIKRALIRAKAIDHLGSSRALTRLRGRAECRRTVRCEDSSR
jgi:hypothetical protein